MYSYVSKGLLATPLAAILPQVGNSVSTMFAAGVGILLLILIVTLIMVQIKKRST
ncbi:MULTISPECIES: hypothetical protein [Lactobacillaceae]|uniref:Gram-positive cocci surface proteins LPxTG domain-containing protein n=1 Tax=Limosilactobacillus alvi TaxID=990412 RepID=A0ABS2EQC6_9LACO|nr:MULTISPECIES: hypothetical protein [Lactobacillaceae]MBM6754546.1 hypothetical protein [Limosilactobacillus alvi]QLL69198.1 hypothetical protein GTO83_00710 [Lactobacillus sp. 3B(2020)]